MDNPIIFCIHDDSGNYWPNLFVALNSLLINSSKKLRVYILHNETLTKEASNAIGKIAFKYEANLIFLSVDLPAVLKKTDFGHFSPASIFRLLVPQIFKDEELIIYLDSDLIFHGIDILEIVKSASESPISAVLDPYIGYSQKHKDQLLALNLHPTDYFNSGLLVMRPNKITFNLIEDFIEFLRENPVLGHPDQDFLNVKFKDVWGKLDSRYNHQACVFGGSLFMPLSSYFGKVIHYTGQIKPLKGYIAPAFIPFWMYASDLKKASEVFDTATLTNLEPDPRNINNVVARRHSKQLFFGK